MRLFSTPESVRAGEISLLAIVETVLAMVVTVWLGVHLATWWPLLASALVAPFMMLRTDESCASGLRLFARFMDGIEERIPGALGFIVYPTAILATCIPIRILTTITFFVKSPAASIREIPTNWKRQVASTDFAISPEWMPLPISPEVIPAASDFENEARIYHLLGIFPYIYHRPKHGVSLFATLIINMMVLVLFVLLITPLCIASIVFRWSIKSTAIIWYPIIWLIRPKRSESQTWQNYIEHDAGAPMTKLVNAVSILSLTLFAVKYGAWLGQHELAKNPDAWNAVFARWGLQSGPGTLPDIVLGWVAPGDLPPWHIATAINAVLVLILWFLRSQWKNDYSHGHAPSDGTVRWMYSLTTFPRMILSPYSIICNGAIFYQAARKLPVPEISGKWWPFV